MKTRITTIATTAALSVAALLAGCNERTETTDDMKLSEHTKEAYQEAKTATLKTAEATQAAAKDAWRSFSSYTIDKKDQAADFLERQSESLEDDIQELRTEAAGATGDAKVKLDEAITKLQAKRRDLAGQVEKTKNATAETWTSVKNETQEKWDDLVDYLQEVRADLRS